MSIEYSADHTGPLAIPRLTILTDRYKLRQSGGLRFCGFAAVQARGRNASQVEAQFQKTTAYIAYGTA